MTILREARTASSAAVATVVAAVVVVALACAAGARAQSTVLYYRNHNWYYNASVATVQLLVYDSASAYLGAVPLSKCSASIIDVFWITSISTLGAGYATNRYAVAGYNSAGAQIVLDTAVCGSASSLYSSIDFGVAATQIDSNANGCAGTVTSGFDGRYTRTGTSCTAYSSPSITVAGTVVVYNNAAWYSGTSGTNAVNFVYMSTSSGGTSNSVLLSKCAGSGYYYGVVNYIQPTSFGITFTPQGYSAAGRTGQVSNDYSSCSGTAGYPGSLINWAASVNVITASTRVGTNFCNATVTNPSASTLTSFCTNLPVSYTTLQYSNTNWGSDSGLAAVGMWTFSVADNSVFQVTQMTRTSQNCWTVTLPATLATPTTQQVLPVGYNSGGGAYKYDNAGCSSNQNYVINFSNANNFLSTGDGGCGGAVSAGATGTCPIYLSATATSTQSATASATATATATPTPSPSTVVYYRNHDWYYNASVVTVQLQTFDVVGNYLGATTLSKCSSSIVDDVWITTVPASGPITAVNTNQYRLVAYDANFVQVAVDSRVCGSASTYYTGIDFLFRAAQIDSSGCSGVVTSNFDGRFTFSPSACLAFASPSVTVSNTVIVYNNPTWFAGTSGANAVNFVFMAVTLSAQTEYIPCTKCSQSGYFFCNVKYRGSQSWSATIVPTGYSASGRTGSVSSDYSACTGTPGYSGALINWSASVNVLTSTTRVGNNFCNGTVTYASGASLTSACSMLPLPQSTFQYSNANWGANSGVASVALWLLSSDNSIVYPITMTRTSTNCWTTTWTAASGSPTTQQWLPVAYNSAGNAFLYDNEACQGGNNYQVNFVTVGNFNLNSPSGCGGTLTLSTSTACPLYATWTQTSTATSTQSATYTASHTQSATYTASHTQSATYTASHTQSATYTASHTQSATASFTKSDTASWTQSATASFTESATASWTQSATESFTQSATASFTETDTASFTQTDTASFTKSVTASLTQSDTASFTQSDTASATQSATASFTESDTASYTHSATATAMRSATASLAASFTQSQTALATQSATVTYDQSSTISATGAQPTTSPSAQPTTAPSARPTATASRAPTPRATATRSATATGTASATSTPTPTPVQNAYVYYSNANVPADAELTLLVSLDLPSSSRRREVVVDEQLFFGCNGGSYGTAVAFSQNTSYAIGFAIRVAYGTTSFVDYKDCIDGNLYPISFFTLAVNINSECATNTSAPIDADVAPVGPPYPSCPGLPDPPQPDMPTSTPSATATPTSTEPVEPGQASAAVIGGAVGGSIAAVAVVGGLGYLLYVRRRATGKDDLEVVGHELMMASTPTKYTDGFVALDATAGAKDGAGGSSVVMGTLSAGKAAQ